MPFALVDCNNFFVSCERVFRPDLASKPVIVLSNNDGCVISRSNEAKALGIGMGQPFFQVKGLVREHDVTVFSSNFQLYGDFSHRVMQHLHEFSPNVEVYSIDEAFLYLEPHVDLIQAGQRIRLAIGQQQKIPVSIGIALTKTLAKLAAELAKKSKKADGVVNLVDSPHLTEALRRVPVQDVWGVGRKIGHTLRHKGILTAYDLTQASDEWLQKTFSVVLLRTVAELRGISCLELEDIPEARKSVMTSRSVNPVVEDIATLKELVAGYASRTAEKLRDDGMEAKGLSVFIRTARFREVPQYYGSDTLELPVATAKTTDLIHAAHCLLERIYKPQYGYYQAGVMAFHLTPAGSHQGSLFDPQAQDDALSPVLDGLNRQYGDGTLKYLAEGLGSRWRAKQDSRSPRYTTRWDELPIVT